LQNRDYLSRQGANANLGTKKKKSNHIEDWNEYRTVGLRGANKKKRRGSDERIE
jgi:hypothetical protein